MKKIDRKQSGFTIIEVVLVLAIAGLIFLVVFLALPQLQRSRRDTARRDQVGRVMASLTQYSSNNNGNFPGDLAAFQTFVTGQNYFGAAAGCTNAAGVLTCESFSDPTKGGVTATYAIGTPTVVGTMFYRNNAVCTNGTTSGNVANAPRQVAIAIALEQGGAYCLDNSD